MLPIKGIIFIGLNIIRLLSILSLSFVFAGTIILMVRDANAYADLKSQDELSEAWNKYEYIPDSGVPTTTWGLFWTQLGHFWVLCICIVCCLSEMSTTLLDAVFASLMPIIGQSFSTAPLGVIQTVLASSALSRYMNGFPLVALWMLFFAGILNILAGIAFGSRLRLRRSLSRSKRDRLNKLKSDIEKGETAMESFSASMRSLAKTGIAEVGKMKDRRFSAKAKRRSMQAQQTVTTMYDQRGKEDTVLPMSAQTIRPIRTARDAFTGYSRFGVGLARRSNTTSDRFIAVSPHDALNARNVAAHDDVLRWRARQENLRAEKSQEQYESSIINGSARPYTHVNTSHLSKDFAWDSHNGLALQRATPQPQPQDAERAVSLLLREMGVKNDAQDGKQDTNAQAVIKTTEPLSPSTMYARKKFKRRTLVLSKMVANVKRGSVGAASAAFQAAKRRAHAANNRYNNAQRMPGAYRRTGTSVHNIHQSISPSSPPLPLVSGLRTNGRPGPWTTVENEERERQRDQRQVYPPPPSHLRSGKCYVSEDVDDTLSRYHSLPVAERFATTY